jgi:hypothetical protein
LGKEQDEQTRGRDTSDPWLRLYIYICVNYQKDIVLGVCEACLISEVRDRWCDLSSHILHALSLSLSPCSPIVPSKKTNKNKTCNNLPE